MAAAQVIFGCATTAKTGRGYGITGQVAESPMENYRSPQSEPKVEPVPDRVAHADFATLAAHYRTTSRITSRVAITFFCTVVLLAICRPAAGVWVSGALTITLIVFFYCARRVPKMVCPTCQQNQLANKLGAYCPECGADGLPKAGWLFGPKCSTCKRIMSKGRSGRCWRIRACSKCGTWLDDVGF
jgi:hypothetical protein